MAREARLRFGVDKLRPGQRELIAAVLSGRLLREYFGEAAHDDCGHCDNCRDRPATTLAESYAAAPSEDQVADLPGLLVHEGDEVTHRRFGRGVVERLEDTRATVRFDKGGKRVVQLDYLDRRTARGASVAAPSQP